MKQEISSDAWHLKQRISGDWNKIDQQLIDSAVKQWRKRPAACFCMRRTPRAHALMQNSKLINSLQQFVNSVYAVYADSVQHTRF